MAGRRISDLEGQDAYDLLGVASTATDQEIRRAYRRAMFDAHPDRGGAEALAKLINAAHELLVHDRAAYDRHRRGEDWEEEPDPWEDADSGVGRPGRMADAPGAAQYSEPQYTEPQYTEPPKPWQTDPTEDDRPFRPFAEPGPVGGLHELSWSERFLNAPMMLSGLLAIGVLVGVIAAIAGSSDASPRYYSGGIPVTAPTWTYQPALPDYSGMTASPLEKMFPAATVPPLSGAEAFLGNPDHQCGISKKRTLWCSGANDHGQLGVGDTDDHTAPVAPATREHWGSVTAGQSHTCGITREGSLFCWGDNSSGQLGTSDHRDSDVPVQISSRTWRSVGAFRDLTCGVRSDHRLYCWGTPLVLGRTQPKSSTTPKRYGTAATWTSVIVEGSDLCATRPGHTETCFMA